MSEEEIPLGSVERVCIVGAGVIGSLFAGHLADVSDVSVITAPGSTLTRWNATVRGEREERPSRRRERRRRPGRATPFEVAIVATKASGSSQRRRHSKVGSPMQSSSRC